MEELLKIQQELNAPKGQYNSFGKYKYRSCEDILAAVKPLLGETKTTLSLSDDIVMVGTRIYVKATATLRNSEGKEVSTTAYAREDEDEDKKGMDGAQVTGAASSYARKYALNGLFSIDDTKDPDATNTHGKDDASNGAAYTGKQLKDALDDVEKITSRDDFNAVWAKWSKSCPALCQNGTEFYNKLAQKAAQYPQ